MALNYAACAKEIYETLGGRENLVSAAHCATRLRLVTVDNSKVDMTALENIDGVKGVFESNGQLQLIIGTGTVNKVYDEFLAVSGMSAAKTIYAPVDGKVIFRKDIPDETFSQGILGDGVGIEPSEGVVYAPIDGEISTVAETKHAIGITGSNDMELLIHVGIDTVKMNGDGFHVLVAEGDRVRAGQKIMTVSLDKIKAAGFSTTTAVLLTNSDDYDTFKIVRAGVTNAGDAIITV